MNDPLVSVIIPVYNVASYLSEALDSVIHQTYRRLEILLIDDGSTDESGAICDEYAANDPRILVVHQENKGLSAARNAGLNRMTGEAVAFLDPDDAYEDAFIETLLTAMLRENADMTACRYITRRTTGRLTRGSAHPWPLGAPGVYGHEEGLRGLADRSMSISAWNKLYRRELWREVRFPEGYVYEDIDTSFRVFDLCHRMVVLDESLYLHRKRPGSITDTPSMKNIQDKRLACAHFAGFIEKHTPEIFPRALANKWWQTSLNALFEGYIKHQGTGREDRAFLARLREQVLSEGREHGIGTYGFRTSTALCMMLLCPWLLKPAYPVYARVEKLVRKWIRRTHRGVGPSQDHSNAWGTR